MNDNREQQNVNATKLDYYRLFKELDDKNIVYLMGLKNRHGQSIFLLDYLETLGYETIEELVNAFKTGDYARVSQIEAEIDARKMRDESYQRQDHEVGAASNISGDFQREDHEVVLNDNEGKTFLDGNADLQNTKATKLDYYRLFKEIDDKNIEYLMSLKNRRGQSMFSVDYLQTIGYETVNALVAAFKNGDYERVSQIEAEIDARKMRDESYQRQDHEVGAASNISGDFQREDHEVVLNDNEGKTFLDGNADLQNTKATKLDYYRLFKEIDDKNIEYLMSLKNRHGQSMFSVDYLQTIGYETVNALVAAFKNGDYERVSQIEAEIDARKIRDESYQRQDHEVGAASNISGDFQREDHIIESNEYNADKKR